MKPKEKKKKQYKEYSLFFMQFGFKEDRRIRDRSKEDLSFWDKIIKDEKKKIKFEESKIQQRET